jgi:hypothetical protein
VGDPKRPDYGRPGSRQMPTGNGPGHSRPAGGRPARDPPIPIRPDRTRDPQGLRPTRAAEASRRARRGELRHIVWTAGSPCEQASGQGPGLAEPTPRHRSRGGPSHTGISRRSALTGHPCPERDSGGGACRPAFGRPARHWKDIPGVRPTATRPDQGPNRTPSSQGSRTGKEEPGPGMGGGRVLVHPLNRWSTPPPGPTSRLRTPAAANPASLGERFPGGGTEGTPPRRARPSPEPG